MAVQGSPRRYDKKFLWAVEIAGLEVAWFETCSEIKGEVGVVEQHEAGVINVADQSPGKVKFPHITLTIGATDNDELYTWWLQVIDAAANSGEPDDDYKKTVSIVQKERDGSVKKRFNLFEAWPPEYTAVDGYDAKAEENVIESVVLCYKRWARAAA